MSSVNANTATRFERVAAILRKAAHREAQAFGGLALSEYSRNRLVETSLGGVRLIALKAHGSCCESGASSDRAGAASSGLIPGLRGLPPFDGSRFPRLPWGGEPVAGEDIHFIADWIDDGAPEKSREMASFPILDVAPQPSRVTVESIPELDVQGLGCNGFAFSDHA